MLTRDIPEVLLKKEQDIERSRFNQEEVIGFLKAGRKRQFGQGGVREKQYQRGEVLRMEGKSRAWM